MGNDCISSVQSVGEVETTIAPQSWLLSHIAGGNHVQAEHACVWLQRMCEGREVEGEVQ